MYKVRLDTWNICTLSGKSRELAGVLKTRKIGEAYKIIFSGKKSTRNGLRVIINKEMKGKVVELVRKSNRVIMEKV